MRPIPYVCPVCPESMVETEDGSARGYYGVLVKDGKPMVGNGTVRDLTCPNDGAALVDKLGVALVVSIASDMPDRGSPVVTSARRTAVRRDVGGERRCVPPPSQGQIGAL